VPRVSRLFGALAGLASGVVAAQDACGPLAAVALERTTITSMASIPGDAASRAPAYCEVQATITPVPGSKIGAIYRLPAEWNGKMLGLGGGGFAGNLRAEAAADGLARGYAVIQNDLGHPSTSALDPSFAFDASGKRNVEGIIDFGHRATHLATVVGKQVAAHSTAANPSGPTGKVAQRAGGKGSRKCNATPTTTTA
jgi:hypothetical protein